MTLRYNYIHIMTLLSLSFQDGINWLAFLNKYKLHGILCDDIHSILLCIRIYVYAHIALSHLYFFACYKKAWRLGMSTRGYSLHSMLNMLSLT